MTPVTSPTRYRAVSMELAAYLDARYVEMRIATDTGETITVVCPRDSIFAIEHHIEQIGRECPEISTWSRASHVPSVLARPAIAVRPAHLEPASALDTLFAPSARHNAPAF